MYQVKIYDGPDDATGITIHTHRSGRTKLENGKINQEVGLIPTFSFSFYPDNPAFGKVQPYRTLITVFNTKTKKMEFEGRALDYSDSMDVDGIILNDFKAEGELAYLTDSVQAHVEFRGTVQQALETQVNRHNSMVEDYKKFEVGIVEVEDPNNYLYFYLKQDETTLDSIERTLVDNLGGELRVRKEGNVRYLDYLNFDGDFGTTEIRLRSNLKSMSRDIDPTDVIPRLVPLGTRIESDDPDATDASQQRITIESVNNGLDYIDNPELIKQFGEKAVPKIWDDVTTPETLLSTAKRFMENQKTTLVQYVVEAYDLSLINQNIDAFECGWYYHLVNPVMGVDETLRIIKKTIDINVPENDKFAIGNLFESYTDIQLDLNRQVKYAVTLQQQLQTANQLLAGRLKTVSTLTGDLSSNYTNLTDVVLPDFEKRLQNLEVPPTPPTDENGYATSRVFPVDYTLEGVNFFVREGKAVGSIEYDMTYGMRDGVLHSGHDIGTNGDRNYTAHATTDGVVRKAEFMAGGIGNAVYVEHTADSYWSNYMHLKSISLSVGQTVKAGDVIGVIGGTGGDYAPHLHFEISPDGNFHSGGNTVNPQSYLGITGDNTTTLPRPV
ncbi:peptidoglycan DD-metalloendopeptidase family protein [Carnobacterium sp. PL17GRE32]|uniref:phage tail spike protein n=1 Tax=Carnobacterium sp. PL17GRE32 TaxID=2592355 RepID=UPI0011EDC609|nr:phage tail spike protein [Carnobacterium sp. PL17GRE32]KAF3306038.1 peptidoglycan DD-metalloendopeptidase family protein [Carnobacterium sp. PL17GRE32]